jgi:hypothetical protein
MSSCAASPTPKHSHEMGFFNLLFFSVSHFALGDGENPCRGQSEVPQILRTNLAPQGLVRDGLGLSSAGSEAAPPFTVPRPWDWLPAVGKTSRTRWRRFRGLATTAIFCESYDARRRNAAACENSGNVCRWCRLGLWSCCNFDPSTAVLKASCSVTLFNA